MTGSKSKQHTRKCMKEQLRKFIWKYRILRQLNDVRYWRKENKRFYGKERKEIFQSIYENKLWGKKVGSEFYSGPGSHQEAYINPYCKMLTEFIRNNGIKSVCDLGCGDFHVSGRWVSKDIDYYGIDIVKNMITHLQTTYGNEKVHFMCLDIVEDELPNAECCTIRQVLQHLSNEEIKKILKKTEKYPYVIVTEHITQKEYAREFNMDKEHGSHTRVVLKSGVYLDEPPYNKEVDVLLTVPYTDCGGTNEILQTVLIKN